MWWVVWLVACAGPEPVPVPDLDIVGESDVTVVPVVPMPVDTDLVADQQTVPLVPPDAEETADTSDSGDSDSGSETGDTSDSGTATDTSDTSDSATPDSDSDSDTDPLPPAFPWRDTGELVGDLDGCTDACFSWLRTAPPPRDTDDRVRLEDGGCNTLGVRGGHCPDAMICEPGHVRFRGGLEPHGRCVGVGPLAAQVDVAPQQGPAEVTLSFVNASATGGWGPVLAGGTGIVTPPPGPQLLLVHQPTGQTVRVDLAAGGQVTRRLWRGTWDVYASTSDRPRADERFDPLFGVWARGVLRVVDDGTVVVPDPYRRAGIQLGAPPPGYVDTGLSGYPYPNERSQALRPDGGPLGTWTWPGPTWLWREVGGWFAAEIPATPYAIVHPEPRDAEVRVDLQATWPAGGPPVEVGCLPVGVRTVAVFPSPSPWTDDAESASMVRPWMVAGIHTRALPSPTGDLVCPTSPGPTWVVVQIGSAVRIVEQVDVPLEGVDVQLAISPIPSGPLFSGLPPGATVQARAVSLDGMASASGFPQPVWPGTYIVSGVVDLGTEVLPFVLEDWQPADPPVAWARRTVTVQARVDGSPADLAGGEASMQPVDPRLRSSPGPWGDLTPIGPGEAEITTGPGRFLVALPLRGPEVVGWIDLGAIPPVGDVSRVVDVDTVPLRMAVTEGGVPLWDLGYGPVSVSVRLAPHGGTSFGGSGQGPAGLDTRVVAGQPFDVWTQRAGGGPFNIGPPSEPDDALFGWRKRPILQDGVLQPTP